jgi:hypothetical protein
MALEHAAVLEGEDIVALVVWSSVQRSEARLEGLGVDELIEHELNG